jgi:hypothetical protein
MVGFPIDSNTALAECQVRDQDGTTLSMADAVAAEWLRLPAYTYADDGYLTCGFNPWNAHDAFKPWTGYWIYVCRCGIQIIYPIPIRVPCGSGVMLKSDRPVYNLCPACDVIPEPVKMCLVVFNTTCLPVTYCFTSGQRFDFEIADPEGRVIWRWSDDKYFPAVVECITLNACSMNPVDRVWIAGYAEFVPIDPDTRLPLPEGLYTLKGWLTADRTMEAAITFEIQYGWGSDG